MQNHTIAKYQKSCTVERLVEKKKKEKKGGKFKFKKLTKVCQVDVSNQ